MIRVDAEILIVVVVGTNVLVAENIKKIKLVFKLKNRLFNDCTHGQNTYIKSRVTWVIFILLK